MVYFTELCFISYEERKCSVLNLFADLLTAAQVFLRRYTALDCRAERMALKEEKFFSCLHSCREKIQGNAKSCLHMSLDPKLLMPFKIILDPDLSNSDPPLDDACSVGGAGVRTAG